MEAFLIGFADLARAAAAAQAARPTVPLALATLVAVEGSSYRQPGARLLVDAEGRVLAGAVSGGCLEGDVAARAAAVCASGQSVRLRYDLRTDLETIWGFGAACDGIAHLLLEPLADWRWLADADARRQHRAGGAVLTVLGATGGVSFLPATPPPALAPDQGVRVVDLTDQGVRAVDRPDQGVRAVDLTDQGVGAVDLTDQGVGAVDLAQLAGALDAAERTGTPMLVDLDAARSVLVDPLVPPIALHCVGAGRGAEAFARIASTLGWTVTILDHRPALLERLDIPEQVRVVAMRGIEGLGDALATLPCDARTAVALLSHVFEADAAWLALCLPQPVSYIGVLGSRSRGAQLLDRVRRDFTARGLPLSTRLQQKVHAPIGLDLGGEDPASIALAAIAEIEAVMHGRPGGFLRERQSPIHTRTPTPQLRASAPESISPTQCAAPLEGA